MDSSREYQDISPMKEDYDPMYILFEVLVVIGLTIISVWLFFENIQLDKQIWRLVE